MDTGAPDSQLNLTTLVEIARTVEGQEALAEAICAHAVSALGLAGATIGLVRHESGTSHLESIAAVGQLSPFIRDMTTPLGAATDATKTALGGEPIFVGDPHGVGDAAGVEGVGRWRSGFGSHAYAILALASIEGAFGVLTLEWPEPQPFPAETRESLRLYADIAALMLRGSAAPVCAADPAGRPALLCGEPDLGEYRSNAQGLVVPAAVAASWDRPPAARIWTAVTPTAATRESAAFAEVMSVPGGGLMLVVGGVSAGPGSQAEGALTAGREVLRAAGTHGSSPAEVLGMLGSSMHSQARGAWASAVAATLHPATGALEVAEAGNVAVITLHRGGRCDLLLPESPPIASGRVPAPGRVQLTLPGDRVALLSGRVAALTDEARSAEARESLARLGESEGAEAAVELLALVCGEDAVAAVAVIELV